MLNVVMLSVVAPWYHITQRIWRPLSFNMISIQSHHSPQISPKMIKLISELFKNKKVQNVCSFSYLIRKIIND
jgi:hypothetical protein